MEKVLLLGDSLVEFGDWGKLLPAYQTMNRGIAGETVEELSARLHHELTAVEEPEHIFLMCGTNNFFMGDRLFPLIFEAMLPRARALCPGARLIVNGLLPYEAFGVNQESVKQLNRELEEVTRTAGCLFFDPGQAFIHARLSGPGSCFDADGVHLSPIGYEVWAREIARRLAG